MERGTGALSGRRSEQKKEGEEEGAWPTRCERFHSVQIDTKKKVEPPCLGLQVLYVCMYVCMYVCIALRVCFQVAISVSTAAYERERRRSSFYIHVYLVTGVHGHDTKVE